MNCFLGFDLLRLLHQLFLLSVRFQGIIKAALGALFQISVRRDGLDSILRVNDETNGALLVSIIQHIKLRYGPVLNFFLFCCFCQLRW